MLLILAGVTINLTIGENGIFRTAEMAGKNYTQAQEQELAGIANFANEINNIIGGTGNNGGSGTDTPEATEQLLKDVAQPGDYVKYDTGIDGIGENQDGIITFRVLYNDDTYGLQIISDKKVDDVTFGTDGTDLAVWQASMNDYNSAIETLNEAAYDYAESSPYAIDGRCVGSVPTVGADGTFNAEDTEVTGTYSLPDEWTLPSDWTSRDTGCKKWTDTNYKTDYDTMEALEDSGVLNILTTGEAYWLASCNVFSYSSACSFNVCDVTTSGDLISNCNLCSVYSDGDAYGNSSEYGLRPCISLRSDIKITGGDGKEATTAYELGI